MQKGAGQAVDGFRFWLDSRGVARSTVKNYTGNVSRYVRWCNEHELDYLRAERDDITLYIGEQMARLQPTTVSLRLIALNVFYDYLVKERRLKKNPAREVSLRKAQARPTEPFSRDELRRMLDGCTDYRERAIFLLLVGAGLRRQEIFGVKREDVNFENRTVRVLGKGQQYRLVAPGSLVMDSLRFALEFDERLCPFTHNDYVWRTVKRIARRSGVKGRIHPHRFRHTFAVNFLLEGGGEGALQQLLGHRRLDQTLYYARAARGQQALDALDHMDLAGRLLMG